MKYGDEEDPKKWKTKKRLVFAANGAETTTTVQTTNITTKETGGTTKGAPTTVGNTMQTGQL